MSNFPNFPQHTHYVVDDAGQIRTSGQYGPILRSLIMRNDPTLSVHKIIRDADRNVIGHEAVEYDLKDASSIESNPFTHQGRGRDFPF